VFALDGQRYALALHQVQRVIRVVAITPLPQAPAIVLGVIDLGGVVIPSLTSVRASTTRRAPCVFLTNLSSPPPASGPWRCWWMKRLG